VRQEKEPELPKHRQLEILPPAPDGNPQSPPAPTPIYGVNKSASKRAAEPKAKWGEEEEEEETEED
jgi:hypothetical protein